MNPRSVCCSSPVGVGCKIVFRPVSELVRQQQQRFVAYRIHWSRCWHADRVQLTHCMCVPHPPKLCFRAWQNVFVLIARDNTECAFRVVLYNAKLYPFRKGEAWGRVWLRASPLGVPVGSSWLPQAFPAPGVARKRGTTYRSRSAREPGGSGPAPCQTFARERSRCARINGVSVACMRSRVH